MLRFINGFIVIIFIITAFNWFLPQEATEIASEILIRILSIIRDLLMMINLP